MSTRLRIPAALTAACVVLLPVPAAAQRTTLTGRVTDATTGRGLEAAQVTLLPRGTLVLSDVDGRFTIERIPTGQHTVRVLRLGYAPRTTPLHVAGDQAVLVLDVALAPHAEQLAGITVVGPGVGSLAWIPGSAAQIDRTQLATTLPLSGSEVLKLVPGVNVQEEEGLGLRANIGVRGLDPDRSRTLLVLEDGVPVTLAPYGEPEMYYTPPIQRMERVEILKGSGSILFGPQTIGGVINYVTPEPPAEHGGTLALQGGAGNYGLGHLRYGGRWANAGVVTSLLRRQATDVRGLFFGQTDATAKVALTLGTAVVGAKVSVYDEVSNATYVGLTDSLFRADPYRHPAPDDRLWIRRYAATLSHESPGGLKTVAYAYQTRRDWQRQDYGYTASGSDYVWRTTTGNRNRAFEVVGLEPRYRVTHRLGEFEGGVRAHYERARDQQINGRTATSRTGEIRDDEIRDGTAFAAFGQNRFAIGSRLRVTPGIRLEHFGYTRRILRTRVRREVRDSTGTVIGTTFLPEDVDLRSDDRMTEVIPGLGFSWFASDRVIVFAGAHRGFAPPRTKDALVYPDSARPAGGDPGEVVSLRLDAERSWNVELGTRSRPFRGVSLEATLFALDFSNQIIEPSLSSGSVAQAALANQGATRHRGLEAALGIDWAEVAGWRVAVRTELRYTLADARFARDRRLVASTGDTVNVNGLRLPYAPRHLVALSTFLGSGAGEGPLSLRIDGVRVSEQFADNFETRAPAPNGRTGVIPAHTVWNATARIALPGTPFRLDAGVKNLTDALYVASRRPEGIKPGMRRHVQVGLEWAF